MDPWLQVWHTTPERSLKVQAKLRNTINHRFLERTCWVLHVRTVVKRQAGGKAESEKGARAVKSRVGLLSVHGEITALGKYTLQGRKLLRSLFP